MTVGAVGSSNTIALSAMLQHKPAQQEIRNERENDGDKDEGAKAVKQPSPTVNTQGQRVGSLINTTA